MRIGTEGTAPGVEQGKELSLSVEERSSPESRKARADADGPQPVTYIFPPGIFCIHFLVTNENLKLNYNFSNLIFAFH